MGLKASSTCALFFDNVRVPAENLLGEIGKGHQIAFNILNLGRHKLPTNCLGSAKEVLELSAKYAKNRYQFGTAIADFPLIGKKLAEMNILTYVLETMVYRVAGLFDQALNHLGHSVSQSSAAPVAASIAEYAIECSIIKVFGTEALNVIVDEGVQIHGGYGFTQDYKIERMYRDARITRIFEGTNEINRLLIAGTLIKKANKGQLPLLEQMERFNREIEDATIRQSFTNVLEQESYLETIAKKIFLLIGGLAIQQYGHSLEKEQEVVANLADLLIQIYAINGVLLRTKKLVKNVGQESAANAIQMTQVFVNEAFEKIESIALEALSSMDMGEEIQKLRKLTVRNPINVKTLKRKIAERVTQAEKYID